MSWLELLEPYWEVITAGLTTLGPVLSALTVAWVLTSKKNPTSAAAWCLLVILLPLVGPIFFLIFGYQHVNRPLALKRQQKRRFQHEVGAPTPESSPGPLDSAGSKTDDGPADIE